MRRKPPPREVEALALECLQLKRWLTTGPGVFADVQVFATVARAYEALLEAVGWLERGPYFLRQHQALPRPEGAPAPLATTRPAAAFTADEIALLDEPVLTPSGWIVPGPLVQRVDALKSELGSGATDADALRTMIDRAAAAGGRRKRHGQASPLAKLKTRVSRARAVTRRRTKKVLPG